MEKPMTKEQSSPDTRLSDIRRQIDGADAQGLSVFDRRMRLAADVAQIKAGKDLPVLDASREAEVVRKTAARETNPDLVPYAVLWQKEQMRLSRGYQTEITAKRKAGAEDTCLWVHAPDGVYPVWLTDGGISRADGFFNLDRRVLIVTDSGVPETYVRTFASRCRESITVTVPAGEASKSVDRWQQLSRTMLDGGFTRSDCVVGVGGGMVCDLAAFTAATYMRGVDFYAVPTTLLAMTDASVGGKCAVNSSAGGNKNPGGGTVKNALGVIRSPGGVLVDTRTLATLPERETACGLCEMLKMALTLDAKLYEDMRAVTCDCVPVGLIERAIRCKIRVVEADMFEQGPRRVLNFGHTLAHGMEAAEDGRLLHGECVALGMLPMCSETLRAELASRLRVLGLPTVYHGDVSIAMTAVAHDKKAASDVIVTVVVDAPGVWRFEPMTFGQLADRMSTLTEGPVS